MSEWQESKQSFYTDKESSFPAVAFGNYKANLLSAFFDFQGRFSQTVSKNVTQTYDLKTTFFRLIGFWTFCHFQPTYFFIPEITVPILGRRKTILLFWNLHLAQMVLKYKKCLTFIIVHECRKDLNFRSLLNCSWKKAKNCFRTLWVNGLRTCLRART